MRRTRLWQTHLFGRTSSGAAVRLVALALPFGLGAHYLSSTQLDAHPAAKVLAWATSAAALTLFATALPSQILPTKQDTIRALAQCAARNEVDASLQDVCEDIERELEDIKKVYSRLKFLVLACALLQVAWPVYQLAM